MKLGPRTEHQLARLARTWRQGEHVAISGATGSGKTLLARQLVEIRLRKKGSVIVFINKLTDDPTIVREYKGWTRWSSMKRKPHPGETRVLLWPDTDSLSTLKEKVALQKEVFGHAMDVLAEVGRWTVQIDEGLYFCSPTFLNLGDELAILHAMGRSSDLTLMTLMQRPANVPLIIYGSASNAFVGRTRERADVQRLSELGGRLSGRMLADRIDTLTRHDFLWIPVSTDGTPEVVNLRK